jgi:hypothetical protein
MGSSPILSTMAKLYWTVNTTTFYSYELTEEELALYKEDEDKFFENVDVLGNAEIIREKSFDSLFELEED